MSTWGVELKGECDKALEHFKKDLAKLRTGRASASLLDGIQVDYYGSSVPLIQLGMINTPEPRLIAIQVYDSAAVESVEKAIRQSDLGLNPSRDGQIVRIAIPSLTEERRKEFIKKLHKMGEETKVNVRNHRRDKVEDVKKAVKKKEIAEDDSRRHQEEIQKVVDKATAEVDSMVVHKEKEIMEV